MNLTLVRILTRVDWCGSIPSCQLAVGFIVHYCVTAVTLTYICQIWQGVTLKNTLRIFVADLPRNLCNALSGQLLHVLLFEMVENFSPSYSDPFFFCPPPSPQTYLCKLCKENAVDARMPVSLEAWRPHTGRKIDLEALMPRGREEALTILSEGQDETARPVWLCGGSATMLYYVAPRFTEFC